MNSINRMTLYKLIWCRIRFWQNMQDISDQELADSLQVAKRTLKDYDRNAKNITLEKLDHFLSVNSLKLKDLSYYSHSNPR